MSELVENPQAMDVFIGTQSGEEQDRHKSRHHFTFYQRFMRFLLRGAKMSLEYVTRELIAKCHLYELLVALQVSPSVVALLPFIDASALYLSFVYSH